MSATKRASEGGECPGALRICGGQEPPFAASQPPELFAASSRLPESFKKERREAVQNPTNRISGWAHTHFTLQFTNTSHHFDVQVERYRSREQLVADFDQLLAFDSGK